MLEESRLHRIRALLSTLHQVSTEKLIQHLGVSRETVRRDILKLENQGVLRRVHGGVIAATWQQEPPLAVRKTVREKEKRDIARCTVQQLSAGQTLFIDAGSTTSLLAEELVSMPGMTVITNSLCVALKLTESEATLQHEVILLGGCMGASVQATSGALTISELRRYRADVALLSPVGISCADGVSSFSHHEAAIAGMMAENAKATIIMADNGKIGVTSRVIYASLSMIDLIISDTGAVSRTEWSSLLASGVNTLIAS